jgi:hypothetical protein
VKEQILTLERTDDLHSLRDKILRTQANRLLLVWPAPAESLDRKLDLMLMRRWAGMVGADLVLVGADPPVRTLAAHAGIPCYPDLTAAALAAISARKQPSSRPFAFQAARRRPPLPKPPSRKHLPLRLQVPVFLAALLFPGIAALITVPTAKIHAAFPIRTVAASVTLAASACTPLSLDVETSGRRTASGRILAPVAYSTGTVAVKNASDHPVNMPAGLRITSESGIVFLSTTGFMLPPYGTRTAEVRAVEPGSGSNLPAGALTRLDGQPSLFLSVSNPRATTGGASAWRSAVSPADLDSLRSDLTEQITAAGKTGLRDLAGPAMTLLEDSIQYLFDPNDSPEYAEHTAVDTVGLSLHARATGLACPNGMLSSAAKSTLSAVLEAGETLFAETIAHTVQSTASGQIRLSASGEAAQIPAEAELLPALRLLTPAAARTLLRTGYHAAGPVTIEIVPGWFPVLPLFPFRMEFLPEAE